MAYTIGAYVSVKGEEQFTKAMRDLKTEMSYTKAESEALTSAYDKNDNSEEAVNARTQAYKNTLELQERAVEEARKALERMREKGVEPASEEYRNMEKNLNNLQTQANKTQVQLNKLGDAGKESGDSVAEGGSNALADMLSGNWSGVLGSAAGLITEFAGIGAAAIEAAKGIYQLAQEVAGDADDIITEASKMGIDTATYQKLEYASNFVDVSVDTMGAALKKISAAQADVSAETGRLYVGDTGYSLLVGYGEQMKSTTEIFYRVIDDLGSMEDTVKRNAVANELFGKSYDDLLPLVQAGSSALQEYGDYAESMGYIMDEEELENWGELNNQLDEMKYAVDELKRAFLEELFPVIKDIIGAMIELINHISDAIDKMNELKRHADEYSMVGGSVGADEFASNYDPIL